MYVGRIFPSYFCINACGKDIFLFLLYQARYTHGERHRYLLISLYLQVWANSFQVAIGQYM